MNRTTWPVLLVPLFASATTALAQTDDSQAGYSGDGVEEIVVTGRRREELLKDVPEQITVFSAADIQNAQISSFQGFAALTPNLQTFDGFRKGVLDITVRGIPTVQGGEPPVTVLVDGIQVSGLDFVNQDLFDLESIQVLRGPQGAVYGRGAIGGAILINTRRPANELEGSVAAQYTTKIDEYRINGSVSGPIAKDLASFKLAASHTGREGFIDNSMLGTECDFNDETTVRGMVSVTPTEDLTIDAKASYLDGRTYAGCTTFSTDADPFLGYGKRWPSNLPRDFKQYDDREIKQYSLKLDYTVGLGTLTSASSYQLSESFSPGDLDFGPVIQPVFFENPVDVEAWNTDIHFVSTPTQRLTWVLGAYYQDRTTDNVLRVGLLPLPLQPPFFGNSVQHDRSKASAAYGQVTYQLTDKVELSGAIRYDQDKRESEDRAVPGSYIEDTFTAVQPQGSLKYRWTDDLMTYLSIGRGFRSGGFNSLADTLALGLPGRRFEKETATSYEVGLKTSFMDGVVDLSAALFTTDFENQQNFFVDLASFARVVTNFPKTRINGAELELKMRPTRDLDVTASVGIADGEIRDGGAFAADGAHSPNSHQYTFNLIAQHVKPLTSDLSLRTRLEYQRLGSIYYDAGNRFKYQPTSYANAIVGLDFNRWTVSLVGRNLTDERIPTDFSWDANGQGQHSFFQNEPRRYGIEVRTAF